MEWLDSLDEVLGRVSRQVLISSDDDKQNTNTNDLTNETEEDYPPNHIRMRNTLPIEEESLSVEEDLSLEPMQSSFKSRRRAPPRLPGRMIATLRQKDENDSSSEDDSMLEHKICLDQNDGLTDESRSSMNKSFSVHDPPIGSVKMKQERTDISPINHEPERPTVIPPRLALPPAEIVDRSHENSSDIFEYPVYGASPIFLRQQQRHLEKETNTGMSQDSPPLRLQKESSIENMNEDLESTPPTPPRLDNRTKECTDRSLTGATPPTPLASRPPPTSRLDQNQLNIVSQNHENTRNENIIPTKVTQISKNQSILNSLPVDESSVALDKSNFNSRKGKGKLVDAGSVNDAERETNPMELSTFTSPKKLEAIESLVLEGDSIMGFDQTGNENNSNLNCENDSDHIVNANRMGQDRTEKDVSCTNDVEKAKEKEYTAQLLEVQAFQASMGDFLVTDSMAIDSSFAKDADGESILESVVDTEAFETSSTISAWEGDFSVDDEDDPVTLPPFRADMNCHGLVHVRLLRAQRLSCSSGSMLQASISLPPWNGRIRSTSVTAFQGSSKSGVCARWDKDMSRESGGEDIQEQSNSLFSMVHAYNSEDSPIPSIKIELTDLALQMFEREVCSVELSCKILMRQPGVFRRKWCEVSNYNFSLNEGDSTGMPLILVEACFEPTTYLQPRVLLSSESTEYNEEKMKDPIAKPHPVKENISEIFPKPTDVEASSTLPKNRGAVSKPHLFRISSSWRPSYCAICSSMIGWRLKGYQCEECNLDCCVNCQLIVDIELPCGSQSASQAVENAVRSKLTVSNVFSIIAPVKDGTDGGNKGDGINATELNVSHVKRRDSQMDVDTKVSGVGSFQFRILKACIFRNSFPAEVELDSILHNSDKFLRSGDYYTRVSWTAGEETKRTKTVFQTAKPRFDSPEMSITA